MTTKLGPEYVGKGIRFRVGGLLSSLRFVRFPVSVLPPEGFLGWGNNSEWQGVVRFVDARWCNDKGKPLTRALTHWTAMDDV